MDLYMNCNQVHIMQDAGDVCGWSAHTGMFAQQ